jgi:uncharacterized membrane protein
MGFTDIREILMTNKTTNALLAAAVAAAAGLSATLTTAQAAGEKEKCFGIATAGGNDCASAGNNSCAGTSKADYDGKAWKYVAKGTCTTIKVTLKDGTVRTGSLTPL